MMPDFSGFVVFRFVVWHGHDAASIGNRWPGARRPKHRPRITRIPRIGKGQSASVFIRVIRGQNIVRDVLRRALMMTFPLVFIGSSVGAIAGLGIERQLFWWQDDVLGPRGGRGIAFRTS